jgi:hypothetical protein
MKRRRFLRSLGIIGIGLTSGISIINLTEKIIPKLAPFKGKAFLEAGYIYAPYIPIMKTPILCENKLFQPTKRLMSRYAEKQINGSLYNNMKIND